jgi:hypothetical protein
MQPSLVPPTNIPLEGEAVEINPAIEDVFALLGSTGECTMGPLTFTLELQEMYVPGLRKNVGRGPYPPLEFNTGMDLINLIEVLRAEYS